MYGPPEEKPQENQKAELWLLVHPLVVPTSVPLRGRAYAVNGAAKRIAVMIARYFFILTSLSSRPRAFPCHLS